MLDISRKYPYIIYRKFERENFQRIKLWTTITSIFPLRNVGLIDSTVLSISTKHFISVAVSCTKYLLVFFQMSLLSPPMNVLSFLGTKKVLDKSEIVYYISSVSLRENLIKG